MQVEDIVVAHWKSYGRNYYSRYDYENVPTIAANFVIQHLRQSLISLSGQKFVSHNHTNTQLTHTNINTNTNTIDSITHADTHSVGQTDTHADTQTDRQVDRHTDSYYQVELADEFTYVDPIDESVSVQQGIRILFTDGSRIIFRLSGKYD